MSSSFLDKIPGVDGNFLAARAAAGNGMHPLLSDAHR
jgi:hypothetical protein